MYKPSRAAIFTVYLFTIILCLVLSMGAIAGAVMISEYFWYAELIILIVLVLFCIVIIPTFFARTRFTITEHQLILHTGVFIFTNQFMRADSIKSLTTIITPLSGATGLNFLIINALGSRMVVPFLNKKDVLDITSFINQSIRDNK